MMAAAAFAAGAFFLEIGCRGHAPELEGLGNVFLDGMLDFMQFVLRFEKAARHGVLEQRIALFFERGDFLAVQRLAAMLFFVERLALAVHFVELAAGGVVGQKSVNAAADGGPLRLRDDGFAKFARLIFNNCCHKFLSDIKP